MELSEAIELLEITEPGNPQHVKNQYRRMMRRHHPDASGDADSGQAAQAVNEAYALLKQAGAKLAGHVNASVWKAKKNPDAYCMREIFVSHGYFPSYGEERVCVAKGKYFWDPMQEDFEMFLYSIHRLAAELAGGDGEESGHRRMKLFFLLGMQFIEPAVCLKQLYDAAADKKGRAVYSFHAMIRHKQRTSKSWLKAGERLYPKCFRGNRIIVQDARAEELGELSFDENELYFLVIPILKQKMGSCRMTVTGLPSAGRDFWMVRFELRIEREDGGSADVASKIRQLLLET